jgi:NAD(P)-dependent dehydrogenase (short-subunit alcohol dehydrogenase family)
MELHGKVAIVTGAGNAGVGGLGVAYAKALASQGAAVVVSDIDREGACRVARELVELGHAAMGIECDVSSDGHADAMVAAALDAFGRIDILVNNAGLARGRWSEASTLPTEDWMRILAVNTVGPLICARACRRTMARQGGGVVINQSSGGAFLDAGAYTVSKLALNGITRVLAAEFADDGIRVNGIAPGMMSAQIPQVQVDALLAMQTVRRQGTPEDLIGALLFLCSDRSSFVNGQTLLVDGGLVKGRI